MLPTCGWRRSAQSDWSVTGVGRLSMSNVSVPDDWDELIALRLETTRQAQAKGLIDSAGVELRPPATLDDVATAEARLGARLDVEVRELLLRTNGWHRLDGYQTLISCDDLGQGELWDYLTSCRDAFWDAVPEENRPPSLIVDPHTLIPVLYVEGTTWVTYSTPASDPVDDARPLYDVGVDPIPCQTLKSSMQDALREDIAELNEHV